MVMGGDSCSEGCGFESWHHILDGHFFTYICCKICTDFCLKRPKINDIWGRCWPILKNNKNFQKIYDPVTRNRPLPDVQALIREGRELRLVNDQLRKEIERLKGNRRNIESQLMSTTTALSKSKNDFENFEISRIFILVACALAVLLFGMFIGKLF